MRIFFSVGEPSGDQHAAHLIHEMQRQNPSVTCCGFGGPKMQAAGFDLHFQLTDLAVMGVLQVLPLLWQFIKLVGRADRFFRESRPDAVVLVDFPGFNWWIARKAKAAGIPVFYYMPPQLWAWAPWRIRRIRRFVDHVLTGLPFEQQWYADRGVEAVYVGHPFFDEVADTPLDPAFMEQWQSDEVQNVAILPGSRNQEVQLNWPVLCDVMRQLSVRCPQTRFLVACYKDSQRQWCLEQLHAENRALPIHFFVGKTSEIIELAECSAMVSGSVSLEMLARRTPAVVLYRASRVFSALVHLLVSCRYASLPNLIAGREIMPEFLFSGRWKKYARGMTDQLQAWLSDRTQLQAASDELDGLCREFVVTGATRHTATVILDALEHPAGVRHAA